MNAPHQQVLRTIRRHGLCPPGSRVLAGVSGGSDSVALTLLLADLAESGGLHLVGLAHFNHRLRPTSGRDEEFCRALARQCELPIVVEATDVASYAVAQRLSIEEAARRLRYDFLHRAARDLSADRVAVGHTRDDQAETFLLKLVRGAGPTGLAGIYPRRGLVVRPLLDVSRADLRTYLDGRGQRWMEDETNDDLTNPRNRIRHRVLPELEAVLGAPASPAIARAAEIVREDGQWLDELADRLFDRLVTRRDGCLEIDVRGLAKEPPAVRRRVVLAALRLAAPEREIGLEHVEMALGVASGEAPGGDVPGSRLELRDEKLVLQSRHARE